MSFCFYTLWLLFITWKETLHFYYQIFVKASLFCLYTCNLQKETVYTIGKEANERQKLSIHPLILKHNYSPLIFFVTSKIKETSNNSKVSFLKGHLTDIYFKM